MSKLNIHWKTLALGAFLHYIFAAAINGGNEPSQPRMLAHAVEEPLSGDAASSEGHEGEVVIRDTTVTVIVLFLIALTICFEEIKESIEEAADREMMPVIEGLFGELTVLGFLSVCTFCVTKLGWFTLLSEKLFGDDEEEELLETFELVHYMLFFIMVFFGINVLVLVKDAEHMKRTWWIYNRACRDDAYMAEMNAILASHSKSEEKTTFLRYLGREMTPFRESKRKLRSELQLFRGLRHEFVVERSLDPPFLPHEQNLVPDEFDFGRYLCVCMYHELGHIVHLQIHTWVILGVITAIFWMIALVVEDQLEWFSWIWVGTGWLVFLFGAFFDYHMVEILEAMAANFQPIKSTRQSERGPLIMGGSKELPDWTRIDLDDYTQNSRGLLARLFLRGNSKITRQDALYWMERKGPRCYMIVFQVQMVFTATYVSMLVLIMFPFRMKMGTPIVERVLFLVLSLLPMYLLLSKYQTAVSNYVMACSIGVHRRPGVISQVIRDDKVSHIIQAMVTMHRLQNTVSFKEEDPDHAHTGKQSSGEYFSSVDLEACGKTFDAIDVSKSGTIETSDFGAVLKGLGVAATEESLKAMTAVLDEDGDGSISREEFMNFYRDHIMIQLDDHGIHHLAETMFRQIDADGSGEISMSEFKQVLDSFNVGFTVDEIGELINELDEDDNGTIGEEEFVKLLEKHRLLFEKIPLPKLE
ncbi:Troponin C, isoform 1 [Seminavis robusta]|uniref:Calmodulin n=1 Tax=Seminavis robusta TaxID=568900 RepID=A0A9N8DUB6_9STRA|nr:Troponin C, isoform 1 [Seminavis robusta]|eukprot:Sro362_g126730.1 Troponin C, isoform 1 (699) ;mRNA; r:21564-23809